jgi:hypothetical protein
MKSRTLRRVGHVTSKGERRNATFCWGNMMARYQSESTGINMILKWIIKKQGMRLQTGFTSIRIVASGELL